MKLILNRTEWVEATGFGIVTLPLTELGILQSLRILYIGFYSHFFEEAPDCEIDQRKIDLKNSDFASLITSFF